LLWSVLFSVLVFAHVPGPGTVTGALLVVAGGLYILRREQQRAAATARASLR
jgi:drug/metabolite transporter (DMT)-like permease